MLSFVGRLVSQQYASVSQGRIYFDKCTCCYTEIKFAEQTFYHTESQYTDTEPASFSTYPITVCVWQRSHLHSQFLSHWLDSRERSSPKAGIEPRSAALETDSLTTRPSRRSVHRVLIRAIEKWRGPPCRIVGVRITETELE